MKLDGPRNAQESWMERAEGGREGLRAEQVSDHNEKSHIGTA